MPTESCNLIRGVGGVAQLTLTRAPVNALDADFLERLAVLLAEAEADPKTRALLVTSPFRVLSAGMDLKAAQALDLDGQTCTARAFTETFARFYGLSKPVVVAVPGAAIAGGLFFVLCADVRLAAPGASFGLAEVRVGASLPYGTMEIARAELATGLRRRLLLTGQPIDAETALGASLIDRIVPADDLVAQAQAEAERLAELPQAAYAAIKRDIRGAVVDDIARAVAGGIHAPGTGWFYDDTKAAMGCMVS